MAAPILTQARLKELLHFDPETGDFVWKVTRQRASVGSVAGFTSKTGYKRIKIYGKSYPAHHLAFLYMTGAFPIYQVDHINGDGEDNRWVNLRDVDQRDNMRNQHIRADNNSGVPGVCLFRGRWRAVIYVWQKQEHLGMFDDFFNAVCARKSAENRIGFHPNHGRGVNFLKRL